MVNIIIIVIMLGIIGGIVRYLYKTKKRGETCIGCPYSKQCGSKCNSGCNGVKTESKLPIYYVP